MREIPLTKGYVALVDDEDYERVATHNWIVHAVPNKPIYARGYLRGSGKGAKLVLLHRFIMGDGERRVIYDHINRNGLDCRKGNLRICTYRENNINKSTRSNVSGYRGVECLLWNAGKKFRVRVDQGHVATVEDAVTGAHIYDCISRIRHGRFARTNFPYRWPDGPARGTDGELSANG
jgi:hypothetical protein